MLNLANNLMAMRITGMQEFIGKFILQISMEVKYKRTSK
jgi:hypothetical protein